MAILQEKAYLISIIILNYQTNHLVLELLRKLGNDINIEIIVIDNSPDNTLQSDIQKHFPYIIYHYSEKNLGFAAGNNIGIKQARGEWIMILNSDTETTDDDLKKLLHIAIQEKKQVIAAKLVGKDQNIQNSIGYFDSFFRNPLNWLFLRPRFIDNTYVKDNMQVDFALGAALLIHKSIFQKIGYFDTDFFMYFEDIDFCYRLHQNNIPILYSPDVQIVHFGGASANLNIVKKSQNYYQSLNRYLTKHRGFLVMMINKLLKILW